MQNKIAVILFACLLLMGASIVFGTEEQLFITAQELYKSVTENRSEAETKYLGKTMQIEGIVVSKGMSKYLTPNVVLSSHADGPEMVVCVLPRVDVGKLSDFTVGQQAKFSGRIHSFGERVIVKECQVVAQ